jgi:hypothetical protein
MLKRTIGVMLGALALSGVLLSGCGSGQQQQNVPTPQPEQQPPAGQQLPDTQGTVEPQQSDTQGGGLGQ